MLRPAALAAGARLVREAALLVFGVGGLGILSGLGACIDPRATLAQSENFAELRPELIAECCACLADEASFNPQASCREPGGPPIPDEDPAFGIPCLCTGTASTCRAALASGNTITVSGACIATPEGDAPCASACANVLSFDAGGG